MMKLAVLASLAASAAAFAPELQRAKSTALAASPYANELGAMKPLGFWDPLKIVDGVDQERFDDLRETEIKHGRVAMLAVTGYLVTAAGIRIPGLENIPDGLKAFPALHETFDGKLILIQMMFFFVIAEAINRDAFGLAEFPGDYRNGFLDFGWDKLDDKTKERKRTIELNQGRAAMMGITGLIVHEVMGNSILPSGYLPGH